MALDMARPNLLKTVMVLLVVATGAGFVALAINEPAVPRTMLAVPDPTSTMVTTSTFASGDLVGGDTAPRALDPASASSPVPAGDGGQLDVDLAGGCLTGADHAATGEVMTVAGSSAPTEGAEVVRYSVEVEIGLAIDADCFAAVVESVLADERSWGGSGRLSLQRVDQGPVDFRVALLSPARTDAECAPLETNGIFSCWSGTRAAINVWRWEHGTADYADALAMYREYVINHEVGHALTHGHVECPAPGEPAPVMQQQTKGLDGCSPNGYPLDSEL